MLREIRVSKEEREILISGDTAAFPTYKTQLMNTANQNTQATRSKVVGSMSETSPKLREQHLNGTFDDWVKFYSEECEGTNGFGKQPRKCIRGRKCKELIN